MATTYRPFGIQIDASKDNQGWKLGSTPPDEAAYAKDIKDNLDTIASNPIGLLILTYIKDDDDDLTIVPFNDLDAAKVGSCNNDAVPTNGVNAAPKGDFIYKGNNDIPGLTSRYDQAEEHGVPLRGTGKGSDVKVHFTNNSLRSSPCQRGIYASKPDESLLHELVHGIRAMEGHSNQVPTEGKLLDYDNDEEFLAIVVANIYVSAKTNSQENKLLRENHHGHNALKPPFNTSAGFLSDADNLRVLAKYYWMEYSLYQDIALVQSDFNPIRELVFNGTKYNRPYIQRRIVNNVKENGQEQKEKIWKWQKG